MDSSPFFISIPLNKKLEKEEIVSSFVKDKRTNSIVIELNHKYEKNKVVIPINIKNWLKFLHDVEKRLKDKGITDEHIKLIKNTLDNNWELVTGMINNDKRENQLYLSNDTRTEEQQQQKEKSQQEKQQDIPLLSVLEAKRSSEGFKRVIGRIVGRSTNFRVISRCQWKCQNPGCQNRGLIPFNPPRLQPLKNLDNTTGSNPSCFVCKTYGSIDVVYEYKNAKILQLDDIDTIEEKFDRLDVIMYDDASEKIIDGEIVEIEGYLRTQKKIGSSRVSDSSKLVNTLHSDKPIVYRNKKEIKITQKDIDNFYRWKTICNIAYKKELEVINQYNNLQKENRPDWIKKIKPMTFEQRLAAMFAPNVYGHVDKKIGILRSIVGGSKTENGAENGRRGRLHTLLIGDPGTAKTSLAKESTRLDSNARMVDATGASGKSLVGIVDKENDSLMVKYGVVVAAKNSFIAINEAGSMSHEDQWHLIGIAEEGETSLDKWGEHISINAPTTLILTANPLGTKWESSKISKDKMAVIRQNLLDRLDQIYGFFDTQTEEEMEEFVDELDKIASRKPHNYNHLSKFLQYAKTIESKLTGTTKYRLNRFSINAKLKGMTGNRSFSSIKRIAEAHAKLNLSWEVDDIIASKTMKSLQLMYNQYGTTIEQIQNPRDLTVEVFFNILKENDGTSYSVRELCRKGVEKNKHVDGYLKKNWELRHNKELRTIIGILEQKENIKIMSLKPLILQYSSISSTNIVTTNTTKSEKDNGDSLCDLSDPCDHYLDSVIKKNNENVENNKNRFQKDPQSHRSHGSHSKEINDNSTKKCISSQKDVTCKNTASETKNKNDISCKENNKEKQLPEFSESPWLSYPSYSPSLSLLAESDKEKIIKDIEELKSVISKSLYEDVLSVIEKEKNSQTIELVVYNAKNLQKNSPNSDIYVCSVPKCYSGDKWFMLKHPCKNFYK